MKAGIRGMTWQMGRPQGQESNSKPSMETSEKEVASKKGNRRTGDVTSDSEAQEYQGQTPSSPKITDNDTDLLFNLGYQISPKEQGKYLVAEAVLKDYHRWPRQENGIVELSRCRFLGVKVVPEFGQSLAYRCWSSVLTTKN